jgi:ABC-type uncharacterized transport system substrate-binding protein
MNRRDLLSLLGASAASRQGTAWAQNAKPVIGFLSGGSPNLAHPLLTGFHQGLADSGFVEHKNFEIEYRWAESHYDRLPIFAADLALREVALIAVTGSPAAVAVQVVTKTIPTVFYVGVDPVKLGLVVGNRYP